LELNAAENPSSSYAVGASGSVTASSFVVREILVACYHQAFSEVRAGPDIAYMSSVVASVVVGLVD